MMNNDSSEDSYRIGDAEIVPRNQLEQTGDIEGVPVYACPRCDYQWITEDCDCPDCLWAGMCQEGWA
jgi:rubrerythrin